VPPKLRDLVAELEKAGFVNRGGKGTHRNFVHPTFVVFPVLSGHKPRSVAKPARSAF
jgi:predicted RNA binding protein YcfA (HicA-like mRNA interferase family)